MLVDNTEVMFKGEKRRTGKGKKVPPCGMYLCSPSKSKKRPKVLMRMK